MKEFTGKVIQVGSSLAVTLPAKEAKNQNIKKGDEINYGFEKKHQKNVITSEDAEVFNTAKQIVEKHRQDFENLANR